MSDIMDAAIEALSAKNARAYDMLITTGLMKFLDRPVTLDEAADMARAGRITSVRPMGHLYNETYSLDGVSFLFIGQMQTRKVRDDLTYKLIVDLPYRFIAPPKPCPSVGERGTQTQTDGYPSRS